MIGNSVVHSFHVPGTMAANLTIKFKTPEDMTLEHVSSVVTTNGSSTIKIGNSDNDDAYVEEIACGVSGTPAEITRTGFVGDQYPHISKGTIVIVTIDYDGAAGTAGANLTVVLTFKEG